MYDDERYQTKQSSGCLSAAIGFGVQWLKIEFLFIYIL
jgi:hypothetical protein